ncbi:MAG: hypothetical protein ACOYXB_11465, partial [Bacteroidota bacterium]
MAFKPGILFTLFLNISGLIISAAGQEKQTVLLFDSPGKDQVVLSRTENGFRAVCQTGDILADSRDEAGGSWISILSGTGGYSMLPGQPELPLTFRAVESGADWNWKILLQHADSIDVRLADYLPGYVFPYQSSPVKGKDSFCIDTALYQSDLWYGGPLVSIRHDGVLRGVQVGSFEYRPVKYNPGRGLLR